MRKKSILCVTSCLSHPGYKCFKNIDIGGDQKTKNKKEILFFGTKHLQKHVHVKWESVSAMYILYLDQF